MNLQKAATVFISILLSTTAHADDDFGPVDFCRDLSLIAKQVMIARQQNRPMSEAIPVTTDRINDWSDKYGFEMDMDKAEEMAAAMVMDAYEVLISPVKEYKRIKTTEFENAVFKECYEAATADSDE